MFCKKREIHSKGIRFCLTNEVAGNDTWTTTDTIKDISHSLLSSSLSYIYLLPFLLEHCPHTVLVQCFLSSKTKNRSS